MELPTVLVVSYFFHFAMVSATSQCDCSKSDHSEVCSECGCESGCMTCFEVTCSGPASATEFTPNTTPSLEENSAGSETTIIIAAIVSIAMIIVASMIFLTLTFYWRYRIRSLRERNQMASRNNLAYNVSTPSTNSQDPDSVYSVIDDRAALSQVPPTLPPNKAAYYQEIESDQTGSGYETPIKYLTKTQPTEGTKQSCNKYEA